MKTTLLISLSLALVFISSCAGLNKYPFTEPMLKDYRLDTKNIKSVRFYLSAEITMFKLEPDLANGKQGTTFLKKEGGLTEKLRVRAFTICTVEKIDKEGYFHVRFESGSKNTLKFQAGDNGRYYLQTDYVNNRHQVEYGNDKYYVTNPSLISFLTVDMRKNKTSPSVRTIR
jgi:hypothetical protein